MCLVPKRCNDMMNLGRLQGFEVCICILLIIITRQGKLLYLSVIVCTIYPSCLFSACSSVVLSCMLWWGFKGGGWHTSHCKPEVIYLLFLQNVRSVKASASFNETYYKWWPSLLCPLVRSRGINPLTAPAEFSNIQEGTCELQPHRLQLVACN